MAYQLVHYDSFLFGLSFSLFILFHDTGSLLLFVLSFRLIRFGGKFKTGKKKEEKKKEDIFVPIYRDNITNQKDE